MKTSSIILAALLNTSSAVKIQEKKLSDDSLVQLENDPIIVRGEKQW
jgi:hypothetical protein